MKNKKILTNYITLLIASFLMLFSPKSNAGTIILYPGGGADSEISLDYNFSFAYYRFINPTNHEAGVEYEWTTLTNFAGSILIDDNVGTTFDYIVDRPASTLFKTLSFRDINFTLENQVILRIDTSSMYEGIQYSNTTSKYFGDYLMFHEYKQDNINGLYLYNGANYPSMVPTASELERRLITKQDISNLLEGIFRGARGNSTTLSAPSLANPPAVNIKSYDEIMNELNRHQRYENWNNGRQQKPIGNLKLVNDPNRLYNQLLGVGTNDCPDTNIVFVTDTIMTDEAGMHIETITNANDYHYWFSAIINPNHPNGYITSSNRWITSVRRGQNFSRQLQTNEMTPRMSGFINVPIQSGANAVSSPLVSLFFDTNRIDTILRFVSGDSVQFWDGSNWIAYVMNSASSTGWTDGSNEVALTNLPSIWPGRGFIYNRNSSMTNLTLCGTVPNQTNSIIIPTGKTMLGSVFPGSGKITEYPISLNVRLGDSICLWTNGVWAEYTRKTKPIDYPYGWGVRYTTNGYYNSCQEPKIKLGEGFFYINRSTPFEWVPIVGNNSNTVLY